MISIVIPLYNKAHVILNTLRTVFSQTYTDFEVIIVDDGSTDNGVEVIKEKYADETRIRIITQENQGVSVARNRGIEEAKGDYVSLLDGDDEWHPEYLEHVVAMTKSYPNAGMYCTAGLIQNANGSVGYRVANKYIGKTLEINYFENPDVFSHTSATTLSKKVFMKSHKSPKGMKCCEDLSLFYDLALMAPVIYCGLPLSKYVGGVPGQTTSASVERRKYLLQFVIFLYNKFADEIKLSPNVNLRKSAEIYLQYILRHRFKNYLTHETYQFNSFFNGLSECVFSFLSPIEKYLYANNKRLAILYINITKLFWRMRRYPVVGAEVNVDKILSKYLSW